MKILVPNQFKDLSGMDIIFGNIEVDTNKTVVKIYNMIFSIDESELAEKLSFEKSLKGQIIRSVKIHPVRIWKNQKAIVSDELYRYKN